MIKALSARAINHLTIVKPDTLLSWQRRLIKNFWCYNHKYPGRKTVAKDIKALIIEMKNENYLWGCKKISNELRKINIDTLLGRRFYLFIILDLKSRKIAKWSLTEYPGREFVKQQIIDFY